MEAGESTGEFKKNKRMINDHPLVWESIRFFSFVLY